MDLLNWFRKKNTAPVADTSCCHCIPPEYNTPQVYYIKFGDPKEDALDVSQLIPKKRKFTKRKNFSGEIKKFIDERCELDGKNYIKVKDLYDEYIAWSYVNSVKRIAIGRFGAALLHYGKKLNITGGRRVLGDTTQRYYVGIKLKKLYV